MAKEHGERIARLETRVDGHDMKFRELGKEMETHGESLHKHGRELQGMAIFHEATNEGLRYVREVLEQTPNTVRSICNEITLPLVTAVQAVKDAEEKRSKRDIAHKNWMLGAGFVFTSVIGGGIWAVLTVIDLIKALKGM